MIVDHQHFALYGRAEQDMTGYKLTVIIIINFITYTKHSCV